MIIGNYFKKGVTYLLRVLDEDEGWHGLNLNKNNCEEIEKNSKQAITGNYTL